MDGGCINAWLKDKLTECDKNFILKYVNYVNSFSMVYSIKFKTPEITSKTEKNKIIKAIGYLPAYELIICGFADDIFLSGEAIIKEFEGYLKLGVGASDHGFNTLKGEWHYIKKRDSYYHLIDWEFTSGYFNRMDGQEKKAKYSIKKFQERIDFLNSLN